MTVNCPASPVDRRPVDRRAVDRRAVDRSPARSATMRVLPRRGEDRMCGRRRLTEDQTCGLRRDLRTCTAPWLRGQDHGHSVVQALDWRVEHHEVPGTVPRVPGPLSTSQPRAADTQFLAVMHAESGPRLQAALLRPSRRALVHGYARSRRQPWGAPNVSSFSGRARQAARPCRTPRPRSSRPRTRAGAATEGASPRRQLMTRGAADPADSGFSDEPPF